MNAFLCLVKLSTSSNLFKPSSCYLHNINASYIVTNIFVIKKSKVPQTLLWTHVTHVFHQTIAKLNSLGILNTCMYWKGKLTKNKHNHEKNWNCDQENEIQNWEKSAMLYKHYLILLACSKLLALAKPCEIQQFPGAKFIATDVMCQYYD